MKKGFTIIEISIVLILIGIVIGGVIAGQSMVKTARINAVIADFAKYKEASGLFFTKYGYLPGDMPNADTVWGAAEDSDQGVTTDDNGDGDGTIDAGEEGYFWYHLSNAGFINGNIGDDTGQTNSAPKAQIVNSYFDSNYADYTNNNLVLGNSTGSAGAINGQDSLAIDTKMDDGLPDTGEILATDDTAGATGCENDTPAPDIYLSTDTTSDDCRLYFNLD